MQVQIRISPPYAMLKLPTHTHAEHPSHSQRPQLDALGGAVQRTKQGRAKRCDGALQRLQKRGMKKKCPLTAVGVAE